MGFTPYLLTNRPQFEHVFFRWLNIEYPMCIEPFIAPRDPAAPFQNKTRRRFLGGCQKGLSKETWAIYDWQLDKSKNYVHVFLTETINQPRFAHRFIVMRNKCAPTEKPKYPFLRLLSSWSSFLKGLRCYEKACGGGNSGRRENSLRLSLSACGYQGWRGRCRAAGCGPQWNQRNNNFCILAQDMPL